MVWLQNALLILGATATVVSIGLIGADQCFSWKENRAVGSGWFAKDGTPPLPLTASRVALAAVGLALLFGSASIDWSTDAPEPPGRSGAQCICCQFP